MEGRARERYGKIASGIGICLNLLLAVGKILTGVFSGILSVTADGFNNLADCGSSVVSLLSFKLAAKPADKEHPFGHARIEYIASMIVAFIVLLLAFELGKEAVGKILQPEAASFSLVIVVVLCVSVAVKLGMFFLNRTLGKRLDSDVLKATATDSISDCVATGAVLISTIISHYTKFNLDGYMGLIVALIVAWAGIGILRDTMSKLVGQAPDETLIQSIRTRILAHPGVLGLHDLYVYNYGPNRYYASVHIEVDASVNVVDSHELVDEIEREFARETDIVLTGHLDPIDTSDPMVNELRMKTEQLVKSLNENYSMHDFRAVRANHYINLIFEVAIPFESELSEEEVKKQICQLVENMPGGTYHPVVLVEKQ